MINAVLNLLNEQPILLSEPVVLTEKLVQRFLGNCYRLNFGWLGSALVVWGLEMVWLHAIKIKINLYFKIGFVYKLLTTRYRRQWGVKFFSLGIKFFLMGE